MAPYSYYEDIKRNADAKTLDLRHMIADRCNHLASVPAQWGETIHVFMHPWHAELECRLSVSQNENPNLADEWRLVATVEHVQYNYASSCSTLPHTTEEMQQYLGSEEAYWEVVNMYATLVDYIKRRGNE